MFTVLGWRDYVKISPSCWGTTLDCFIDRDLMHGWGKRVGRGRLGTRNANLKLRAPKTRHCIHISTTPLRALGPRCRAGHWGCSEACRELTGTQGTESRNTVVTIC